MIVHRLGKPREGGRPVIVRFCHKKKKNEIMYNKKKLKGTQRMVYVNDDFTSMRAKMLSMVNEQGMVKNVATMEWCILAWLQSGDRPVALNDPDDLKKVEITQSDWKKIYLDYLINA